MEKLDLSHNQLVSVGPGVFRGLSRLRQLYLHNNRLSVVQQGSLDMLPGLEVSRNTIEMTLWIPDCLHTCLSITCLCVILSVQVLQLNNNNISQIDSDALAPLYSLAVLALEGNNLHHLKFKTFISLHTTDTHIQLSGL